MSLLPGQAGGGDQPRRVHPAAEGARDPAAHVHPLRGVREGDGAVQRGVHHVGRRVRQAAGTHAGHCQEEAGRASQDGLARQLQPQEAPGTVHPSAS